jgi:hypothetical protein
LRVKDPSTKGALADGTRYVPHFGEINSDAATDFGAPSRRRRSASVCCPTEQNSGVLGSVMA